MESLLKRAYAGGGAGAIAGGLSLDISSGTLFLTAKRGAYQKRDKVLNKLIKNAGTIVPRNDIIDALCRRTSS
jgi:hypothetical protein